MKNKKVISAIVTFLISVGLVFTALYAFKNCHQEVNEAVQVVYTYEGDKRNDIPFVDGLKSAVSKSDVKIEVIEDNNERLNIDLNTKYITGLFNNKASTRVNYEDVTFINTNYDAAANFSFPNVKHLHASYATYAETFLSSLSEGTNEAAFITDSSFLGDTFSDFYEDTLFKSRILLADGESDFSPEVNYLKSLEITDVIIAVDNLNLTEIFYHLSAGEFTGNVYIPDFSFYSDLTVPPAFSTANFTLYYLSAFNFTVTLEEVPENAKMHAIIEFYRGFAAGMLISSLEKESLTVFTNEIFVNEVTLGTGPSELASFIYPRA